MQLPVAGRRLVIVIAATVVGATGALVAPAATAEADGPTHVEQHTSVFDADPVKSVSVMCPPGSWVFAVGGRIVGNDGNTLLTRMSPSGDLRSATVVAKRRANSSAPFAVTVYAACRESAYLPVRVMATVDQSSTVTVGCPGQKILVGLGFAHDRPVGDWRIDALVPDAALKEAHLHATGGDSAGPLTVFGICYEVHTDSSQAEPHRVEAVSQPNGVWPATVSLGSGDGWTYGVGARVTGHGELHVDAFLPFGAGTVRAARAGSTATGAGSRSGRLAAGADDTAETLAGYAIRLATFH